MPVCFRAENHRMALEQWIRRADSRKAEYFYNDSKGGCWATRNLAGRLQVRNPAPRKLSRKEVEALFRDPED